MICNRRIAGSCAAVVISAAALGLFGPSAAAEEPWQPLGHADREGVTLERRTVPGSKFYEYRAQALTSAPPEAVLHGIWSGVTEQIPAAIKQRKVLSAGAAEILFYDQLKTPVVSDRDYTLRIWWKRHEDSGAIEVPFGTVNHLGPPPAPGYVRIPTIRGDWIITSEPVTPKSATAPAQKLTKITYLCYSEPGGSIPAFMARGAQQDEVLFDIHRILARAKDQAQQSSAH